MKVKNTYSTIIKVHVSTLATFITFREQISTTTTLKPDYDWLGLVSVSDPKPTPAPDEVWGQD